MYLQALLSILCVASVSMMSTNSTTFKDVLIDFPALRTKKSTETMLCDKKVKLVCETPDERTLSVLYPGFFKPASRKTTFRKRRQSSGSCAKANGSYAIIQLPDDKDMCCAKDRQLRALYCVTDVFNVTYDVVHLLGLRQYQFLPYTSCGKRNCSGQCLPQFTPTSVLVWNVAEGFLWVKFVTVNLPTECSCQNVGA
ncbi:hypothetical protein ACJMK2_023896 [Sinanodonta woodiana]|uniref:Spaetzle domain-containing protein n=1 Tax=Sinanodonta woodiana TaxID=1069815 RepID=A0ABD3T5P5_SINWO